MRLNDDLRYALRLLMVTTVSAIGLYFWYLILNAMMGGNCL